MNNVEEFNDNLFFVFEKLLMDKELAEKFAECKTEDELYNFCLKIKGGYTKEEWEKFAEIIYKLTINKENDKILLDNDLEEIGGGSMTNNIGKKALSGTLAALTAATVLQVGSVGASAASSSSKPKTSVSQRSSSPRWKKIIRGVLIGAGVAAVAAALGYGVHRFIEHKKEKNNTPKIFNEQPNSSIKNNKQPGNRFRRTAKNEAAQGMRNMGHSCYLSTIVQQMESDPGLRELIMNDTAEKHPGEEKLFKAIQGLVLYADNCRKKVEVDENDFNNLKELAEASGIYGTNQEDAEEILRNVMDRLYPKYRQSVLNAVYVGDIMKGHSMQDLIAFDGDTGRKPASFLVKMTEQDAESGDFIGGEFYPTPGGRIFVPISRGLWNAENQKGALNSNCISIPQEIELCGEKYTFVGSILYDGNLNSGHYVSITSSDGKKFEIFNDSTVKEIGVSETLRLTGKGGSVVVYGLTDEINKSIS